MIFNYQILIVFLTIELTLGQFVKYHTFKDTAIGSDFYSIFKLMSFSVSKHSPLVYCMNACNSNTDFALVTLDSAHGCTLFNDHTLLIHAINSLNTTLFSKKKLVPLTTTTTTKTTTTITTTTATTTITTTTTNSVASTTM